MDNKMNTYTVTGVLTIRHTDEVLANSLKEAMAMVDEWIADDFTEDSDCSRSWNIEIVEIA